MKIVLPMRQARSWAAHRGHACTHLACVETPNAAARVRYALANMHHLYDI